MRIGLVGYSGDRPPPGGTAGGGPPDPGDPPVPETPPEPLVLVLEDGAEFRKSDYLPLGYNRFDVMCIGAAAGWGGRLSQHMPTTLTPPGLAFTSHLWKERGGPGGGGVQRTKGKLSLLPSVAPVVVGVAGSDGPVHTFSEDYNASRTAFPARDIPAGTDGGYSSFGGTVCRASGGLSGHSTGIGGVGGKGGTTTPGGGPGSTMWKQYDTDVHMSPKPGDGTWDGSIGSGGQGGPSRHYRASGLMLEEFQGYYLNATLGAGGKGAYLASVPTMESPGGARTLDAYTYERYVDGVMVPTYSPNMPSVGGAGGGAKPVLVNGEDTPYGTRAAGGNPDGLVVIRLTYEVI